MVLYSSMPKTPTDYSKSLIYKLCCKDPNITDIYIGSTTSLKHRKASHKACCNTETRKGYNNYKYKFIRENGTWENWDMILIEYYPCETKLQLERREREFIEKLKSSLNQTIPTRTYKEYREDFKEQRTAYNKKYREENREHRTAYNKKYRDDNKIKIECECGSIVLKYYLTEHKKTKKHQNYIKNNIV